MSAAGFETFGCRHEPVPQEPKPGMQILARDVWDWTGVGTAMKLPRRRGNFGIPRSEERVREGAASECPLLLMRNGNKRFGDLERGPEN